MTLVAFSLEIFVAYPVSCKKLYMHDELKFFEGKMEKNHIEDIRKGKLKYEF